jgi:hypothetical protein
MGQQVLNGVNNFFGARTRADGSAGEMNTIGAERQSVIVFSGASYANVLGRLPAGATVVGNSLVEIAEAFTLGGTTPTIAVGVTGSEVTNRLALISEAQAEAVGTYSIASAGTLAVNTPLAAAVTISVALGGTTPTVAAGGIAKVVTPYQMI